MSDRDTPVFHPQVRQSEWDALVQRQSAAVSRLRRLIADQEHPLVWNRSYPVDIALPLFAGSSSGGGYPAVYGTLNIDNGATFFVLGLEAPYQVTGVLAEDGSPASLTIPETIRPTMFDYTWSIRDSATDQDWSNIPVPSAGIRTGNLGMMAIGGQRKLAGGAKVTITVNPTTYISPVAGDLIGLTSVTSHSLQFVLSGVAVKDGVLW